MSYNTEYEHYELDVSFQGKLSLEQGPLPRGGGFGTFSEPDETSPRLWAEYLKALPKGLSLIIKQSKQDERFCNTKKCDNPCIIRHNWHAKVKGAVEALRVHMAENARYSAFDGTNIKGGW